MHNLHENKRRSKKNEEDSDGSDNEDEEDQNDPEKQPKLKVAGIKHTAGKLVRLCQFPKIGYICSDVLYKTL